MESEITIEFDGKNLDKNEALNDILNFVDGIYDSFAKGLRIMYENELLRVDGNVEKHKFEFSFRLSLNDNLKLRNCLLRIACLSNSLKENIHRVKKGNLSVNIFEKTINDKNMENVRKFVYTICEAYDVLNSVGKEFLEKDYFWDLGILSKEEVNKLDRVSLENYVKFLANWIKNFTIMEIDSTRFKIGYSDYFEPHLSIYVNDSNMFDRAVNVLINEIKNVVDSFYYAYNLLKGGKNCFC